MCIFLGEIYENRMYFFGKIYPLPREIFGRTVCIFLGKSTTNSTPQREILDSALEILDAFMERF